MHSKNVWRKGQRILTGLTLSSAAVLLGACATEDPPVGSSSSSVSSNPTTSSSSSSTGTTSSSSSSSSSSGPITGVPSDPVPNGRYRVNAQGHITDGGSVFDAKCGNWFGLEGQHEPKDAESNPDGAPLELYIGNMWWDNNSDRDIPQTMDEIKDLGINMIRLPIAPQTLQSNHEQGMTRVWDGNDKNPNGRLKNKESAYPYDNAREALEGFLAEAKDKNLKVLVDIHSCSNYVGWRAGKLDAAPPWVDATREGYEYTRESYTCASGEDAYGKTQWLADLRDIAELANTYDNIIGIDIFNEPWDYTWDQWATLSEDAYEAISSVNEDILIFVEGIGSGLSDETEVEHGNAESNPNWGENFYGFTERPLQIPRERVVISPHTYGPSVFVQGQFMNGTCNDLEGDEAAEEGCQIDIDGNIDAIRAGWEEHFGFLRDQNYAIVIGEFGGNMDWPHEGTREAERDMWEHITGSPDEDWQSAFVEYAIDEQIQACYWSINPESGDTGGIYTHLYDPVSAEEEWGQWGEFDSRKTSLLQRLWNGY
jgi:aryl-phospho-beta-D-glucosidase BglC (GH1 family)